MQQYHRQQDKNIISLHLQFLLLANTGLRFGEARLLRWGNISIFSEDKVVKSKIKVEVGKTGKRIVIGIDTHRTGGKESKVSGQFGPELRKNLHKRAKMRAEKQQKELDARKAIKDKEAEKDKKES